MNTEMIQKLLYTMPSQDVKKALISCEDSETLHIYAFNYNWNNGFDLPQVIIDNPVCSLSTALMIFYLADGYRYLSERNETSDIPDWLSFISELHSRIYNGSFTNSSIAFNVPLSKVQIFKLKKKLNKNEEIFITSIEGKNDDISL